VSAYLYAATRTPFGRFGSALAGVRPDEGVRHDAAMEKLVLENVEVAA
jgi:acetyl-CoA acetyltransferase